jgi:glucose-6-phosphate isomerase
VIAVTTNIKDSMAFGISEENNFGFWDWVGGRFSVCSAVGVLPLSLIYGFSNVRSFLDGVKSIDDHFI